METIKILGANHYCGYDERNYIMIIPIYTSHTEEVPVGNCPHSVKISSGDWACLSNEQYNAMQLQQEQKHKAEIEHFDALHFDIVTLVVWVIAVIISIVKWIDDIERDYPFLSLFTLFMYLLIAVAGTFTFGVFLLLISKFV